MVADFRSLIAEAGLPGKPVMQSLFVDLLAKPDADPRPSHPGFQSGTDFLRHYLTELRALEINHVALNFRFNGAENGDHNEAPGRRDSARFHNSGANLHAQDDPHYRRD
ncbi:hypothetical protein [Maliponia aquimaris]|uniref:hypothetical protein n=1 Tax=Maliponia aquimaris TaxID=1673631 RepID=UPI001FE424F1|nr:hypothetical protein [Maliponia aquimaris]